MGGRRRQQRRRGEDTVHQLRFVLKYSMQLKSMLNVNYFTHLSYKVSLPTRK